MDMLSTMNKRDHNDYTKPKTDRIDRNTKRSVCSGIMKKAPALRYKVFQKQRSPRRSCLNLRGLVFMRNRAAVFCMSDQKKLQLLSR